MKKQDPFVLDVHGPARIMGVINLTPDSFSGDGLAQSSMDVVLKSVEKMIADGADCIDVGAQSTRPGAVVLSSEEEKARLKEALPLMRAAFPEAYFSLDTFHSEVADWALGLGIDAINDVSNLEFDSTMPTVIARYADARLFLNHSFRDAKVAMDPIVGGHYRPPVAEQQRVLLERILLDLEASCRKAEVAGVARDKITIDPGIGFGKSPEDNEVVLQHLDLFLAQPYGLLLGLSRKSFLGRIVNRPSQERDPATMAALLWSYARGVKFFRVHNVAMARDGLKVWNQLELI